MSPYRAVALERPHRHGVIARLRRAWWRVLVRSEPRLVRPRCWACWRTFAPARGAPYSVICVDEFACLARMRERRRAHRAERFAA